jgi:hypothetical protein
MEEKVITKTVVVVQFVNDADEKTSYFNAYGEYHVGDMVVVDTAKGLYVGEVVRTDIDGDAAATYEIIDKIDVTGWRERQRARRRRAELKVAMDAKIAKKKDEALYELISKDDPELAAVLEQYRALGEIL